MLISSRETGSRPFLTGRVHGPTLETGRPAHGGTGLLSQSIGLLPTEKRSGVRVVRASRKFKWLRKFK